MTSSSTFIIRPNVSIRSPSTINSPQQSSRQKSITSLQYRHPTLSSLINNVLNRKRENQEEENQGFYHSSSEISTMLSIREKIQSLMELTINIVIENDATPEIEKEFAPVLCSIEKTYPVFHKQGVHYFSTYCSMQETAKTNQLLSSAGVKLPLENFRKDWKQFSQVIDLFAQMAPPPHAKEISAKFKAVRSSLDTIKKTNERRRQPSPNIDPCIASILTLGKSISRNILDLFEHNYTEFATNLYESLKTDVKAFLKVINEAFMNEFVQSGVMLCDLNRIRSNIFTDCNEIIESLKSAFIFPKEMHVIKELKDTTEGELKRIVDKLSVPFVVIKPRAEVQNDVLPLSHDDTEVQFSSEINEDGIIDRNEYLPEYIPKPDYLTACNRIDGFTSKVFEIVGHQLDYTKDTWENLADIHQIVCELKEKEKENYQRIKDLQMQVKRLEEKNKDDEVVFIKKSETLSKYNSLNTSKLEKKEMEYRELEDKCESLVYELDAIRLQYSDLKAKGDATKMRNAIIEIGKMISPKAKIEFLPHDELINSVKEIVKKEVNKKCEVCGTWDSKVNHLKGNLINAISQFKMNHKSIETVQNPTVSQPIPNFEQALNQKPTPKQRTVAMSPRTVTVKKKLKKFETSSSTSNLAQFVSSTLKHDDDTTSHLIEQSHIETSISTSQLDKAKIDNEMNDLLSKDFETVINQLNQLFESTNKEIDMLIEQTNLSKQPVAESILMVDNNYKKEDLDSKFPSQLKVILHNSIQNILNRSENAQQSFKKRENQYIKTMFQINDKLSTFLNEDSVEFNEQNETQSERDKVIENIGLRLKQIRQRLSDNEHILNESQAMIDHIEKEKSHLRDSFGRLLGIHVDNDRNDDELISICKSLIDSERSQNEKVKKDLNQQIAELMSNQSAIEARITGMSQEYSGSLFDKLDKFQDKSEQFSQKQKEFESQLKDLQELVKNTAEILENSNHMDEKTATEYLNHFCKIHQNGVKVVDISKMDLILGRFDYDKEANLEDILETIAKSQK